MAKKKTVSKIPAAWQGLVDSALAAQKKAYAPYSKFRVGCALEDEKGRVFQGCNVENASYSLCICAERTAIVKMVSEGGRSVKRVVVVTSADEPCFPCGACRQVLAEFGSPEVLAIDCTATAFEKSDFDALLPHRFSSAQLDGE